MPILSKSGTQKRDNPDLSGTHGRHCKEIQGCPVIRVLIGNARAALHGNSGLSRYPGPAAYGYVNHNPVASMLAGLVSVKPWVSRPTSRARLGSWWASR